MNEAIDMSEKGVRMMSEFVREVNDASFERDVLEASQPVGIATVKLSRLPLVG